MVFVESLVYCAARRLVYCYWNIHLCKLPADRMDHKSAAAVRCSDGLCVYAGRYAWLARDDRGKRVLALAGRIEIAMLGYKNLPVMESAFQFVARKQAVVFCIEHIEVGRPLAEYIYDRMATFGDMVLHVSKHVIGARAVKEHE